MFLKESGCTKCCVLQEKNVSQKMDGEACPADGCETRSFTPGSWADRPRSGTAVSGVVLLNLNFQKFEGPLARKLRFYIFLFQFLTEVSHESFVFTFSAFTLARKLRFHIFNFQILKDVSNETFVFTSTYFLREISHKSSAFTSSTFAF